MSASTIPVRSLEQRREALLKANAIRVGMSVVKRDIGKLSRVDGQVRAAELLENPTPLVMSMQVGHLVASIERVGYTKMLRLVTLVGIRSSDRHVGELSERQRYALAALLRTRAAARR
jgi:hypothetical protein